MYKTFSILSAIFTVLFTMTPAHSQHYCPHYNSPPRPWTRQTGSCGRPGPGDFISVPLDFVATWNSSADTAAGAAKLLAHEFVKLR